MSKIKLLSIAVTGLLLVNLGVLAFLFLRKPEPPREGPGSGRETPREIIIRRLHLDDEQVNRYDMLIREHRDGIGEMDRQIRDAKNSLYETLTATTVTGKDSLIATINALQRQVENLHYDHFAGIKNLLRPDQQKDFEALTHELARFFGPPRLGPPHP